MTRFSITFLELCQQLRFQTSGQQHNIACGIYAILKAGFYNTLSETVLPIEGQLFLTIHFLADQRSATAAAG